MPVTLPASPSIAATDNTALEKAATEKTATEKTAIANHSEASSVSNNRTSPADNAKVCWIEVKRYPYQPDHQVELLNLQAEADALIIKLQATGQKKFSEKFSEIVP